MAAFAQVLTHTGILKKIQDQVRFARVRFGQYDLIDFVVVLIGYVVSGEPTLLAFYERLTPFAEPFMALDAARISFPIARRSPAFAARLDLPDSGSASFAMRKRICLHANRLPSPSGLFDRTGAQWVVADVDGTRATARKPGIAADGRLACSPSAI